MRQSDPKIILLVKLKVAEYIAKTMVDRGISFKDLSKASGVDDTSILLIVNGGKYAFEDLLAIFQVLRIHITFETSSVQANLPAELQN